MTFGEKLQGARLAMNLSQIELGGIAGVSERSVYSYEQNLSFPRNKVLSKMAEALRVSVTYLTDENEADKLKNIDADYFPSGFGGTALCRCRPARPPQTVRRLFR